MMLTRARFLATCAAAAVGTAIDGPAAFARALPARPANGPGANEFKRHQGTGFLLRGADGRRRHLVLADVTERGLDPQLEQFSLLFVAKEPFDDGTFEMRHPEAGRMDIFLAAVGARGAACVYEACFTRFRDGAGDGR